MIIDQADLGKVRGFDLRVEVVPDDTAYDEPIAEYADFDVVRAWLHGDWEYVGLIVIASRAGIDLGSDSVWAVERGYFPDRFIDPLAGPDPAFEWYREDMISNAVADADMKLEEMVGQ